MRGTIAKPSAAKLAAWNSAENAFGRGPASRSPFAIKSTMPPPWRSHDNPSVGTPKRTALMKRAGGRYACASM